MCNPKILDSPSKPMPKFCTHFVLQSGTKCGVRSIKWHKMSTKLWYQFGADPRFWVYMLIKLTLSITTSQYSLPSSPLCPLKSSNVLNSLPEDLLIEHSSLFVCITLVGRLVNGYLLSVHLHFVIGM